MNSLREFAFSLGEETKWHAGHDQNSRSFILKAGCLSMIYENGSLRNLSIGNHEVLRMIYAAVRDKEWLTIDPVISDEEFDIQADRFRIKYNCSYKSGDINFSAHYTIEGKADNSLAFRFKGKALHSFEKNRIGFCVLHPVIECAGESCIIVHTNGEMENSVFPMLISPHQPFSDIKSMKWEIKDHECVLDFYGDIFETEDQRNWTDASYKTYSTPLNLPFPVRVLKGEKINQQLKLKVGRGNKLNKEKNIFIEIEAEPAIITSLPMIGIGQSTRQEPISESEIEIIKNLRFNHYRVDIYLFVPWWRTKADIAVNEAVRLGFKLEFVLFLDDNAINQTKDFIDWNSFSHPDIAIIILLHKTHYSTPNWYGDEIVPLIKVALPRIHIGCGTNASFAQLNRNRPESVYNEYICYSVHPQEHGSDNSTLVENMQGQKYTVESARHFANGKGIWISPVNIQRRFNANIENYEQAIPGVDCPSQVDNRLMSLFGACWTIGSLKYITEAGIKGVTFFETVGERGIFQGDHPSHWPEKFQSVKGMIFPLYHVFYYILKNNSFRIIKSNSSNPLKADSLLMTDGNSIKLILANFTSAQQQVIFKGILCSYEFIIKQLDAESFPTAVSDSRWIETAPQSTIHLNEPLLLKPFSVNFIDSVF